MVPKENLIKINICNSWISVKMLYLKPQESALIADPSCKQRSWEGIGSCSQPMDQARGNAGIPFQTTNPVPLADFHSYSSPEGSYFHSSLKMDQEDAVKAHQDTVHSNGSPQVITLHIPVLPLSSAEGNIWMKDSWLQMWCQTARGKDSENPVSSLKYPPATGISLKAAKMVHCLGALLSCYWAVKQLRL